MALRVRENLEDLTYKLTVLIGLDYGFGLAINKGAFLSRFW